MPEPTPVTPGMLLCGATIDISNMTGFLGELLDLGDVGFTRKAIEARSSPNARNDGWLERLLSCIADMLPITGTVAHFGMRRWDTAAELIMGTVTITWADEIETPVAGPPNETHNYGLEFSGQLTEYRISGELEGRMTAKFTISPSGKPIFKKDGVTM